MKTKTRIIRNNDLMNYLNSRGFKWIDFRVGRKGIGYIYFVSWQLEVEIKRFFKNMKGGI